MNSKELLSLCEKHVGKGPFNTKTITGKRAAQINFSVKYRTGADGYRITHIHHGSNTAVVDINLDGSIDGYNLSLCGFDTVTTWKYLRMFLDALVPDHVLDKGAVAFPRGMCTKSFACGGRPFGQPKGDGAVLDRFAYSVARTMTVGLRGNARTELLGRDTRWYVDCENGYVSTGEVPKLNLYSRDRTSREDREVREKLHALRHACPDPRMWQSVFPEEWHSPITGHAELRAMYDMIHAEALEPEKLLARLRVHVVWPGHLTELETGVSYQRLLEIKKHYPNKRGTK